MSDSDSELLTTNRVFAFQNESTIVSARGPNITTSNLTGISFRHNVLSSTMNMPRNYEWQRRAESNFDQRSIGYRRETSPMSIASACDARQRNFNRSINARGMSSQRSVYNGRAGSPMSMRSIDSNATMSSIDIARALKTNQFNKNDRRIIQEALNKFAKQKTRKRIERRRNLKHFLKGYRRKSGYDSGEMASNSSISSDDNGSIRTSHYKNNMSSCRSSKTDIADFRRTIKESNMFNDCTDNLKQNKMQGMVSNLQALRFSTKSMPPPRNFNKAHAQSSMTLQDRFKNGFLLPSQRFNRSVAAFSIPEATENQHHSERIKQNVKYSSKDLSKSPEVNSDDEEIFSELTAIERPAINQRKRSIDSIDDDICLPLQKKPKVASPCKNMIQSKNSTVIEKAKNDFEFAKPAFPVRKSANLKSKEIVCSKSANMTTTERLICRSREPLSDSIIQPTSLPKQVTISQPKELEKELIEKNDSIESTIPQNKSDLSMRPSFIKRKLFTQNMDVTKKTDITLAANSPQNSIYSATQKEKNKARKLTTSQCCLKRDVQSDDNNLLDLIYKIVPAERMNATNQTNKTKQNNVSEEDDDKWDVTSIISARNNGDNVSDTFTDEDTVLVDDGKLQPSPKLARKQTPLKLVTEKKLKKSPVKITQKVLVEKNGTPIKTVPKYVNKFWDTDFESDAERTPILRKTDLKENKKTENIAQITSKVKYQGVSSMIPTKKTSTVDSINKFNNKEDDDKWDEASERSVKNTGEDVSATFTDEDTVLVDNEKLPSRKLKTPPKLVIKKGKKSPAKNYQKVLVDKNGTPVKTVQKYVKTFWDTDFESDSERTPILRKTESKENKRIENIEQNVPAKGKFRGISSMFPSNKTSIINNTVDNVQKFNNTNKSFRICSHRNTKTIAKKTAPEKVKPDVKSCIEPQSKKQKSTKASLDLSVKKIMEKNKQEIPKQEVPKHRNKKTTPKKLKTNKETPKKAKEKEPMEQISKYAGTLRSAEKNKKTETIQRKTQKKKDTSENSTTVNKPQKKPDRVLNEKEMKTSKSLFTTSKSQNIKTTDTTIKKQNNRKRKSPRGDSSQLDTTVSQIKNKQNRTPIIALSRLSDYIFYKKSFTETNNNERFCPARSCQISKQINNSKIIRPVRSCRISKHNDSVYSR